MAVSLTCAVCQGWCRGRERCPYSAKVNDEAVPLVKTGPIERDLGRPDNTAALDVEESLGSEVVGDHMLEP